MNSTELDRMLYQLMPFGTETALIHYVLEEFEAKRKIKEQITDFVDEETVPISSEKFERLITPFEGNLGVTYAQEKKLLNRLRSSMRVWQFDYHKSCPFINIMLERGVVSLDTYGGSSIVVMEGFEENRGPIQMNIVRKLSELTPIRHPNTKALATDMFYWPLIRGDDFFDYTAELLTTPFRMVRELWEVKSAVLARQAIEDVGIDEHKGIAYILNN